MDPILPASMLLGHYGTWMAKMEDVGVTILVQRNRICQMSSSSCHSAIQGIGNSGTGFSSMVSGTASVLSSYLMHLGGTFHGLSPLGWS